MLEFWRNERVEVAHSSIHSLSVSLVPLLSPAPLPALPNCTCLHPSLAPSSDASSCFSEWRQHVAIALPTDNDAG